MAVPPDDGAFGLTISWTFIEWALTGILTILGGATWWVLQLGSRVDGMAGKIETLEERLEELDASVTQRLINAEAGRMQMKSELMARINELTVRVADLPNRSFLETQLMSMTQRLDRIFEAKLGQPR